MVLPSQMNVNERPGYAGVIKPDPATVTLSSSIHLYEKLAMACDEKNMVNKNAIIDLYIYSPN